MRFYGMLLMLYPASFRREYGAEMRTLFAARLAQESGALALAMLWLDTIGEVVANAAVVHWDMLRQDLRYTARTLSRAPGFAATAILVTAIGVGANTAAFSVADFVLIRPLPFKDPDRLVRLWEAPPGYRMELSPPNYRDWKAMSRSFEAMGAFSSLAANLVAEGEPQRIQGASVTVDLLPLLGVQPLIGRLFTRQEESDGSVAPVVLSYGTWQGVFAGDSAILGRSVLLDGSPRIVIGVMPKEFNFPSRDVGLWVPMPLAAQNITDRNDNWFEAVGRLKPGVTVAQAQADMSVVARRLEQQFPKENEKIGATVYALRDDMSRQSRLLLLGLCGAAICVLLIACANLANLMLARSMVRRRELVVRTALGAGRERLVRQLVTESLVLATLGGALGVALAAVSVPLLSRLVPTTLPVADSPQIDLRVLLVAGLLTAITGIGFGVFPAFRASGNSALDALRDSSRAGGGQRSRLRAALVMGEVMACVVLLVSSGLLMRALLRIQSVDTGFRTEGVLTLRTALPRGPYDTVSQRDRFYHEVLTSVRALPGVTSAAFVSGLPMAMTGGIWPVVIDGSELVRTADNSASLRFTTPQFFATLGIPMRKGRDIAETDDGAHPFVAVVSESFVTRYFPNEDPIGKRFTFVLNPRMIVGVVGDVRVRGLEQTSEPQVYLSSKQVADNTIMGYTPKDLVIRSTMPPASLLPSIRRIVRTADPRQPISNVRSMDEIVASRLASRTVQLRVLGAFAAIAFLLAAIGIHGLLSFTVASRKHEFGVRMALGARSGNIIGMVMRQGAFLGLAGVVPGIALAYAAGRGLEALLAGVRPGDIVTFAAAVSLCVAMTLIGSLLPVLRAVRVAPASVFRAD